MTYEESWPDTVTRVQAFREILAHGMEVSGFIVDYGSHDRYGSEDVLTLLVVFTPCVLSWVLKYRNKLCINNNINNVLIYNQVISGIYSAMYNCIYIEKTDFCNDPII